jgi:hypothetical protein
MTPNDDLARWGEPPATEAELALANHLAEILDNRRTPAPSTTPTTRSLASGPGQLSGHPLVEVDQWIEQMIDSVLVHAGLLANPPLPADAGGPSVELRLRVLRQTGRDQFQPVASTHPAPMVLRDLRRVPEDPDRVTLRTGDRVRLEVNCNHDGYLTVFNLGPAGTLNLLHPENASQTAPVKARMPLLIADVELTLPAGRERVYAVWSRMPLAPSQLSWLTQRGVATRDMQRVQQTLAQLRAEDWHAVMLELEHR